MKIVHISLNGYIDGWGYQENLLPSYQARAGHKVYLISSATHFPAFLEKDKIKATLAKGYEYECNSVKIFRLKTYIHIGSLVIFSHGLCQLLRKIQPDIIFHHGVAIPSLFKAAWYKIFHNKVRIVADSHTDEINQTKSRWWYLLYYRFFTRLGLKLVTPFITKYYGVTPGRCDYLYKVYGTPKSKIDLLPIGGDTDLVQSVDCNIVNLRRKYGVPIAGQIIISGGKMGKDKGTDNLVVAFKKLKTKNQQLSLVLFGYIADEETRVMAEGVEGVYLFGWCDRQTTIELLKLSDVACWPIHHTTLIEDALACAVPLILRKSGNTSHSIEGNGEFVESGTADELQEAFLKILFNGHYNDYKNKAYAVQDKYSYRKIAQKVIDDCV